MLQALCQAGFKLLRPLCAWDEGPSAKDPALKAALLCHQTWHGFKRWQKGKTFRLCESSAWLFAQGLILELWWISVGLPREARHYPAGTAASKTGLPSVCPEWWSTLLQNTHRNYVANLLSLVFVFLFFPPSLSETNEWENQHSSSRISALSSKKEFQPKTLQPSM